MTDIVQGSAGWLAVRVGKVTASRIYDVIARTKGNSFTAARAVYMAELIAERLSGLATEHYVNAAMQWGTDHEAEARIAYEFHCDTPVAPAGFYVHPTISDSGASPDGLIGDDGLVEFKCPKTVTHIETLLGAPIDARYMAQMQWQMACTARDWCDFVSYDPRLPEEMRFYLSRMQRNNEMIADMECNVRAFLAELDDKVVALRKKFPSDQPPVPPVAPTPHHAAAGGRPAPAQSVPELGAGAPPIDHSDRNGVPAFLERTMPIGASEVRQ